MNLASQIDAFFDSIQLRWPRDVDVVHWDAITLAPSAEAEVTLCVWNR